MQTATKPVKSTAIINLGLTSLIILVLIFFISREMETVRAYIRHSGWIGLLVSVGLYGLLGLSPIPSEPLTVLLSTVYGPITATLVAGTGNLLAAWMEYSIGERIGNIASFEKRKEDLPFGLGKLPGYGPKFVSILSGIYHVPTWRYLWTAAIPTFAGSFLFAYGGFELLNLHPMFSYK
jgi:uncharacterized membrane protein YdjX (TVP38/TMEM64 family)